MPINWDEAPEGTTHSVAYFVTQWWFKVEGDEFSWWAGGRWQGPQENFNERYVGKDGCTVEERPKEKAMFTVKDIKHIRAYQQLKDFINLNVKDVKRRPYELGVLTKRYLHGLNNGWAMNLLGLDKRLGVCDSFDWEGTPEGDAFWRSVEHREKYRDLHPCPVGGGEAKAVAKKPVPKVPAPAKRLGWWG